MQQHWTGHRRNNNPCPPSLHHPEEEGDSSATLTACGKKGYTRRTFRDTNRAGIEHCCLSSIRKTKFLSTGQYIFLHVSCMQKRWELGNNNPYLRFSTEPWLTPNPGTWLPKSWTQWEMKRIPWSLTLSNLFTSLDSRLTIWPVVVFPMAELLRRRVWNKRGIQRIGFPCWYKFTLKT